MQKVIALLILLFAGSSLAMAQDIITLKSGKELKVKIIHLNPKDINFIPEYSSDTVSLLREEVTMLQYKTGIIIYLSGNEEQIPASTFSGSPPDSLYSIGERDATLYYKGYKGAAIGTLITSLYIPWGLIPAIACSSTPPKAYNLGYKDKNLMKNPEYYAGYTDKAYKIKKKKVWTNFGIGTGTTVIFFILLTTISILAYR